MNANEKLKEHLRKTISLEELRNLYHVTETSELYSIVRSLCDCGNLKPINSSGQNGNKSYPMYMKYKIISSYNTTEIKQEINLLHPKLLENNYLKSHADKYCKYRKELQSLNAFLFQNKDLSVPISKKERSFEIFHEEKALDNTEFMSILTKIGIHQSTLAFYDTPEYCFHDYIPCKKDKMTVLILENKDIWFNLRRMMFENAAFVLFNIRIDGVLYGEGRKITGENYLTQYSKFLNCKDIRYLYWGDIDREGLNIYCSLLKNNALQNIRLFVPAYEKMLQLSVHQQIPDSNDKRNIINDYSSILSLFSSDNQEILKKALRENKRIPQEIINFRWLKEHME